MVRPDKGRHCVDSAFVWLAEKISSILYREIATALSLMIRIAYNSVVVSYQPKQRRAITLTALYKSCYLFLFKFGTFAQSSLAADTEATR